MNKSNLRESAVLQLQEVQRHIVFVEEKLKNVRNEKIWCYRHGKNFQYCTNTKDPATGEGKRRYIAKAKIAGLKNVFQNEYYYKILPYLQKNLKALMDFVKQYDDLQLIQAYEKMPPAKRMYVTPFIYDDKSFAANWQAQVYERRPVASETFVTRNKEIVRSKSELIIANLLQENGVPYHYEFPLKLKNGVVLHPDFYCLNRRTRQSFYWEHFGMMTSRDYANDFVQRLSQYSQNNIFPGKNLLITTESDTHPLNTRDVERLIKSFLT